MWGDIYIVGEQVHVCAIREHVVYRVCNEGNLFLHTSVCAKHVLCVVGELSEEEVSAVMLSCR